MIEVTTDLGDLQIVSPNVILYSDDMAEDGMSEWIDAVIKTRTGYWPDFFTTLASKITKKFGGRIVDTDEEAQVINPDVEY